MTRRVALITGAARGLGRAIALELARDHKIAFTHLTTEADELLAACPGALAIRSDLTRPQAAEDAVTQVLAHFGRIDVLVNNAGQVAASDLETMDFSDHAAMMDVNLFAPMRLLHAAVPHLGAGASVVNLSSMNARFPPRTAPAFGASKAALETWTKAAAKMLGPRGVRVNAVAPGAVDDPDNPRPDEIRKVFLADTSLPALPTPDDIAQAVRFLSSDAARAITGTVLEVSGGYRL